MTPMHLSRLAEPVRLRSTLSVLKCLVSGLPSNLRLLPAATGLGAGDADGLGEASGPLEFSPLDRAAFSCSTLFFHLDTISEASRAMSLLAFCRSRPIIKPALVV